MTRLVRFLAAAHQDAEALDVPRAGRIAEQARKDIALVVEQSARIAQLADVRAKLVELLASGGGSNERPVAVVRPFAGRTGPSDSASHRGAGRRDRSTSGTIH